MTDVCVYAPGPLSCSVCAPKDMAPDDILAGAGFQYPCGTMIGWQFADDKTFKTGEKIPHQCEQNAGRQHWFLVA